MNRAAKLLHRGQKIDKRGRIRFFKSGALLRDRPEAVAKFRKVIDTLLLEE